MFGGLYHGKFYRNRRQVTRNSAQAILSIIWDRWHPESVVDMGCGTGTWLASAKGFGASKLVGLEGAWVRPDMLDDAAVSLRTADLSQPQSLNERFDLAISLEVAEHLPEGRAAGFVHELCSLSDVVLFSAAIPGQGGRGHVNEQWQSYWRDLFRREGYGALDIIRPAVWYNDAVVGHYRQNVIVYVKGAEPEEAGLFDVVHPQVFHHYVYPGVPNTLKLIRRLPAAIRQSTRKYVAKTTI